MNQLIPNLARWYVGRAAAEVPFLGPRLKRDPDILDAKRALAEGRHEDALAAFDRALATGRERSVAHLGRALCLLHLGRESEAGLAIEEAGDDLGVAEVPLRLARVCAAAGKAADALRLIGVALDADAGLADAIANDAHFAPLRDHPMFLQMTGRL